MDKFKFRTKCAVRSVTTAAAGMEIGASMSTRKASPSLLPPRGPCFDYQDKGACDYGDRCRFMHGDDDDRFERRAAERAANGGDNGGRRRRRRPRSDKKLDEV